MKFSPRVSTRAVRIGALGLLLALLCLWSVEQAMRTMETRWTGDHRTPTTGGLGHPFLLWELPAGATEVNGQTIQVNTSGFRGPELNPQKLAGGRRILSIGGSVTFGEGVEHSETFTLDAVGIVGGTRVGVETVLMAAPEYSLTQSRNLMEMRGWSLDPDLLIYSGPGIEMSIAQYVDSEVISSFRGTDPLRQYLEEWASFRIADHLVRVENGRSAARRQEVFTIGRNTNTQGRPRVGTNAYARQLDALVARARAQQVDVVFVMLPVPADLSDTHLTERVQLYRKVMDEIAKRHGIPVIDGPGIFGDSGRDREALFIGSQLLTSRGHHLIGYSLSKILRRWLRGSRLKNRGTSADIPHFKEPEWLPESQ